MVEGACESPLVKEPAPKKAWRDLFVATCTAACSSTLQREEAPESRTIEGLDDHERRELVVVDTEAVCEAACSTLRRGGDDSILAIDLEGTDTCHAVRPCLLQACGRTGPVYLFDIQVLGQRAFDAGLGDLLSESGPRKLLYDSRGDAQALQLFGIELGNFLDVQVAFYWVKGMRGQYVPGMSKALEDLVSLPAALRTRVLEFKEVGKKLFAPELGGSEAVWEERPMPQELTEYAANDVETLFYMLDEWMPKLESAEEELLRQVSRRRVQLFVTGPGASDAKREFPALKDFHTVYAKSARLSSRQLRVYMESEFGRVLSVKTLGKDAMFIEFADRQQAVRAIETEHEEASVSWPLSTAKIMCNYMSLSSSPAPAAVARGDTGSRLQCGHRGSASSKGEPESDTDQSRSSSRPPLRSGEEVQDSEEEGAACIKGEPESDTNHNRSLLQRHPLRSSEEVQDAEEEGDAATRASRRARLTAVTAHGQPS